MKVARRFSPDPGTQRDLAQEGWIAIWRAAQKAKPEGNLTAFLKKAAVWRMTDVYFNQETFGHRRQHSTLVKAVLTDLLDQDNRFVSVADFCELAYHYGEIHRAVDELPPRQQEYVKLRFWGGLNDPEIREHFGYAPYVLWQGAKKKLRQKLRHLR